MKTFNKSKAKLTIGGLVLGTGLLAATPAFAWGWGDAGTVISYLRGPYLPILQTTINEPINARITQMEIAIVDKLEANRIDLNRVLGAHETGIEAETNKSTQASINAASSIAQYQEQNRLNEFAQDTARKLEQPSTTCQTARTAKAMGGAEAGVAAAAADGQTAITAAVGAYQADPQGAAIASFQSTMSKFGTEEDVRRGRAESVGTILPGGDTKSGILFGSGNEGSGASPTRPSQYDEAAVAVIKRLSGASEAPASVRNPVWEKTPDGKLYIESQRRYNALIELSSTSLNAISANHKAQAGLIDVLKNSGVETKKTELSVADLMEEYIRAKFSPKEVKDLATATDSLKILRTMAQSEAFRMWMDYKLLASTERTEALMAAQLPLLADIAMRDKMKEQYKATFNAGGAQTSK